MTRLVLHIDRLVLRGVQDIDKRELSRAVQARLQQLLARPGTAAELVKGSNRARLRMGSVQLPATVDSQALGHAIAGSLEGGLRP